MEEAFEKWLEVCKEVATSQEAISVSEEEAKRLLVLEIKEALEPVVLPLIAMMMIIKAIMNKTLFRYRLLHMGEEEKEIKLSSSWFEVEISGKRGKSFYPFEEEELKVLTEEEFEKLKKLSDLFYFVCPERKLPTELREAEEIEDVRIERSESEGVEKVYLFLSPEKKILEKLREALTKEEREAVEELTRSGKVVGVEIILKE